MIKSFLNKKKTLSDLFFLSLLFGVTLFVLKDLFKPGFPIVADAEHHIARFASFILALKEGQFPPRWAPNLNLGYGYTVLIFNYPLPNFLSALFVFGGLSIVQSFKGVILFYFLLAVTGMYVLAKRYGNNWQSFVAAVIYATAPYALGNVFVRGAIGEIGAFGLFPWVFLYMTKLLENEKKALLPSIFVLSLFMLVHNISTVFFLIMLTIYVLVNYGSKGLQKLILPTLIAFCLAAWFWIPALAEMNLTKMNSSSLNNRYQDRYIEIERLINFPPSSQFAIGKSGEAITLQLGYAQIVILVTSGFLTLKKAESKTTTLLGLSFFCILMLTSLSNPLIDALPFLRFIQFPSRWLSFMIFFAGILVAKNLPKLNTFFGFMLLMAVLLNIQGYNSPQNYRTLEDEYLFIYPLWSAAANEFDPVWYESIPGVEFPDKYPDSPIFSDQELSIEVFESTGSKKHYQIETEVPVLITEKTLYFPGWETKVNGELIDTFVRRENRGGLINFDLSAGTHEIKTQWTEKTWDRLLGNSLTIFGFFSLVGMYLYTKRSKDHI